MVLPEVLWYNSEKYEIRLTPLTEIQQNIFSAELNKGKQKTMKAVQPINELTTISNSLCHIKRLRLHFNKI